MRKILFIVIGIAAGALLAPLVVLLIGNLFYDLPTHRFEGYEGAFLILAGMAIAALVGGAIGAVAGINISGGQTRRGVRFFGKMLVTVATLTLLVATALWAGGHLPKPAPSEQQKEMWASTRRFVPLDSQAGLQLGRLLLACHERASTLEAEGLTRECPREGAYRIGATRTGYDNSDIGWRWESVKAGDGYRVLVRPDPLLEQPGPIFEFDADRLLVRRAEPDAPAFAAESPLPAVQQYVLCLSAAGPQGCSEFEGKRFPAETNVVGPGMSHEISLARPSQLPLRLRLFPQGRSEQGPFELHVFGRGRRYMFEQGGTWHVTSEVAGFATERHPPPHPCELNPSVPCLDGKREATAQGSADILERIAIRVQAAMRRTAGERVILRFDPNTMPGLERAVARRFGARLLDLVPYGPVDNFEERLDRVAVYVWLPTSIRTPGDQSSALARWTDRGGRRREIHVHWAEGTLDFDGRQTTHAAGMDERYLAGADVSPAELSSGMDRMISRLRRGTVRVTTPAGTDLRFHVGARPFNRQTGTMPKVEDMKIRIDRHIEVPAGVLRVAPLETSVNGVMVFPSFWIRDGVRAAGVRLEFANGRIARATATEGQAELENYLRSQPALASFREFCLGMNPHLAVQPGEQVIPYYGYGAGVVRMSLGDNEELGGTVRGGAVRWNFFTDATVMGGDLVLVKAGRLILP